MCYSQTFSQIWPWDHDGVGNTCSRRIPKALEVIIIQTQFFSSFLLGSVTFVFFSSMAIDVGMGAIPLPQTPDGSNLNQWALFYGFLIQKHLASYDTHCRLVPLRIALRRPRVL